ncbi:undecaprenyl-diphosphatase [Candidatus Gottesmanbacteria bacterium RIFCSPHIGHO2_01_FULL_39_10]|uniref:Undecaprenyl-diphosphatase n=1 Tax=Candidatus Gottesmanbacteria bacterium RIFCSPHIGHO2_01_FULL_39_10 TaxID=1798375 RepID=A0A1F5ZKU2_9BACT|nr:MAG: undecaprenyl-diphosphatase [Candidatus Gottesmanbacteria bacterium RIFCSPHIGHO2_01_FULL_39_10]
MSYLEVLILSLIEGLTEFLPISSTGHLILATKLLSLEPTEFVKSFEIIIQFGAILAVVFLYRNKLLASKILWQKLAISFVPTMIVGLVLYKIIKDIFLANPLVTVLSLIFGGVFLIIFEKIYKSPKGQILSPEKLTVKQAVIIGIGQSLSVIPGVSRAASTIISGMIVGLDRRNAVEYSFFLAIPTMLAATGFDLIKTRFQFTVSEYSLLILGLILSFFSALAVIKFFVSFIKNHDLTYFGIYRIIVALAFWIIVL